MAVILRTLYDTYKFLNCDLSDPRTNEWFLMKDPFMGLALIGLYLYGVLEWGPKFMKSRKPFELKNTIWFYNLFQVIANIYITYQSLSLGWLNNYKMICQPVIVSDDPTDMAIAWKVCYFYMVIKMLDLLDTVFFVMRKKATQVSFLHVYHHSGMVMLSWAIVKWLPGGHLMMLLTINSIIHTIMYTYYMITIDNKSSPWWKKYVTQLQILQFGLIFLYFLMGLIKTDCEYPKFPLAILVLQNLFILLLFVDFYIRTYIRKPKSATNGFK